MQRPVKDSVITLNEEKVRVSISRGFVKGDYYVAKKKA